jgi:hypothetical protein
MKNKELAVLRKIADGLPIELELVPHSWVFDKNDMAEIGVEIHETEIRKQKVMTVMPVNHYEKLKQAAEKDGTRGVQRYSQGLVNRLASGQLQSANESILHHAAIKMEDLRFAAEMHSIRQSWANTWAGRLISKIKSIIKIK